MKKIYTFGLRTLDTNNITYIFSLCIKSILYVVFLSNQLNDSAITLNINNDIAFYTYAYNGI